MKLIVGLGNPGPKYQGTRHNIGFEVIDALAAGPGVGPFRGKFQSQIADWQESGQAILLVKPETFMNLSGRAVRQIVDFYKLSSISDMLVVSDDLTLPLGKLRVKPKGSHGGQNGLRDIQQQLGTDEYARLRVGIGQCEPGEAVDFVLSRFKPGERQTMDDAVAKAVLVVVSWVKQGLSASMNLANGPDASDRPAKKPRPEKPKDTAEKNTNTGTNSESKSEM